MNQPNPYQPPSAHVQESQSTDPLGEIATTGQRLANLLIDYFCFLFLSFFVGIFLGIMGLADLLTGPLQFLFSVGILCVYYIPTELLGGVTIGKVVTKTRVVRENGQALTFPVVLGRTLCRFIPFEAFSFLGGRGHPVGWHDRFSGTRVVRITRY